MTESIAKVMADLKHSGAVARGEAQWRHDLGVGKRHPDEGLYDLCAKQVRRPQIIDATGIYHSLVAKDEPVYLYEDHPCIAPPFFEFAVTYENGHGNVIVMHCIAIDRDAEGSTIEPWEVKSRPGEEVDWPRVRWTLRAIFWLGGKTGAEHWDPDKTGPVSIPTHGPVHMEQLAIYEDGQPADINWTIVLPAPGTDPKDPTPTLRKWEMARLVLLATLNFMNCRNVELVDSPMPRSARRRIERTAPGITVKELSVFPTGKRYAGGTSKANEGGVPLHSVRGHFAHYGDCCPGMHEPRGLLFGKLAGRYFVAQHARGTADNGVIDKTYVPKPEEVS